MKINFDELELLEPEEIERHTVRFPFFLPISPYGAETGEIEALSSYLCRQAEAVCELPHRFAQELLRQHLPQEEQPSYGRAPADTLRNCNGTGVLASRWIQAIKIASQGQIDASFMTLTPIQHLNAGNGRGLQKLNLCWCDECWQEDMRSNRTPYLRLYWLLQSTTVCVKHNRRLSEHCPNCGQPQLQFPKYPRQWICDRCCSDLHSSPTADDDAPIKPDEIWISQSIFNLIARIGKAKLWVDQSSSKNALHRICEASCITTTDLAHRLSIDSKFLKRMESGQSKPYFPALMDLCYRLDLPVDEFLFSSDNLIAPELWRDIPTPMFMSGLRIPDSKKQELRAALHQALEDNPKPPISISQLARRFGVSYSSINFNFPDEYHTLRKRFVEWEKCHRRSVQTDRLQNLTDNVFSLVRKGIYPSDRKLRDLGYVTPSDLRRDDIIATLRTLQDIYSELRPD